MHIILKRTQRVISRAASSKLIISAPGSLIPKQVRLSLTLDLGRKEYSSKSSNTTAYFDYGPPGLGRRESINSFVPKSLTAINIIMFYRWTTDYIVNDRHHLSS